VLRVLSLQDDFVLSPIPLSVLLYRDGRINPPAQPNPISGVGGNAAIKTAARYVNGLFQT